MEQGRKKSLRRWLLDSQVADKPPLWMIDEWNLMQAAHWAQVAPWELEQAGEWWINRVLSAMDVEEGLRKAREEKR